MKPMLITEAHEAPIGDEWVYETKYDGFRCILEWNESGVQLSSRNEKCLNKLFPEIIRFCNGIHELMKPYFPISFDGEIVHLQNDYKSEFSIVQTRGRMKNVKVINEHGHTFPCHYVVFDLLEIKARDTAGDTFINRKSTLTELFRNLNLPLEVDYQNYLPLQLIKTYKNESELWTLVKTNNGEGIVAKKKNSQWLVGKRTNQWLKVKNWRTVDVVVTKFDKSNEFFTGSVYKGAGLIDIVTFRHGLTDDEAETLSKLFLTNGVESSIGIWELEASICVKIHCIDFDGKHLREPRFHSFDFTIDPKSCNWRTIIRQLNPLPEIVPITHPDKPIWPKLGIEKDDYLFYLQTVAPYMLPFLHNRLLTVIRYPHGATGEKFYQKNVPDYAPDFVSTSREEEIDYIVCNEIRTLLWLGIQLALEFHIPFQTITSDKPAEIVFDLDPPSVEEFSLAVEAALRMKAIFDQFNLKSFVKTSGGKGMQVYIPLPFNTFSYEDTRIFTKFVCEFLCEQEPQWFTIERMKKNRGNKLYLDYVQHHEGKTIVAPYSPRGNEIGTVATPLHWDEVKQSLTPKMFTLQMVMERVKSNGNPFREIREVGESQDFRKVLEQLSEALK